jgi:4-hydroxybenzoate polyprenyltransferase
VRPFNPTRCPAPGSNSLRLPNLFTVPGDPIAGFLLACGAANQRVALLDYRVAFAVIASLCLYSAGLVMNDLFDLEEDRRDRPEASARKPPNRNA